MKTAATVCCSLMLALATASSFAQDAMKKDDAMSKKEMTAKDSTKGCHDPVAMPKKDGTKKGDAMMKKDAACDEMMKKDTMKQDGMMKKDGEATMMKK